jgi:hypothetical protein
MPCYQSTSLPSGVTTTGRTGYTTEAECLNACKQGACCDGTTCTVKPQCQCQCNRGSCCGPDTVTLSGITGPTCRGGTRAECDARGGVWRDCVGCAADAADPSVAIRPCQPSDGSNVIVPVFKGVGTTCAAGTCQFCDANGFPKTGSGVGRCYCYCTVNGGTIPQFVNITINWSFSSTVTPYGSTTPQPNPSCTRSGSITATLTRQNPNSYSECPWYAFATSDYRLEASFGLSLEGTAEVGRVLGFINVCSATGFGPPLDKIMTGASLSETFLSALTRDTGLGTGVCFSRFTGLSQSNATPAGQNSCDALPGWSCSSTSQVTINGFQ